MSVVYVTDEVDEDDQEEKEEESLELYQSQSTNLVIASDCSTNTVNLYFNRQITETHLGSPFGLSVGIAILAVLCLIDLYARKTEMEKAQHIALGRIAIEVFILIIYYIVTLTWVGRDNDCADAAGAFYSNCPQFYIPAQRTTLEYNAL